MYRKPSLLPTLAAALIAMGIAGCGDDDPTSSSQPITMDVNFEFNVDGQPLLPNQMVYTNPAGRVYSITKLRFVLTDIHVYSEEGNDLKLKDLHYFDLGDASSFQFSASSGVPHAEWNRIAFTFGLDEARNVRDRYINMTKFHTEMAWPTGMGPTLGYHYMQLEGNYEQTPGGATAGYTTHTGAHQIVGTDPDPLHYYFTVDLPFTPTHVHEGGEGVVTIHFELNGWYMDHTPADGTDTQYDFTDYPAMIMANAAAQDKLQTNGPFCFSATMTSSGGHH